MPQIERTLSFFIIKMVMLDFPSGLVDKNLPANAGYTDLIPGPEDSTCHRVTKAVHHKY